MKYTLLALSVGLAAAATGAQAFCVHNDLKDRTVTVTQEEHPDWKRQDTRFVKKIAPGTNTCCEFKNMDCNPNGRQNSLVGFEVVVDGDPALRVTEIAAAAPEATSEEFDARITLRLPPSLKTLIENSATVDGDSVNAWVVDALSRRAKRGSDRGRQMTDSFDL